MKGTEHEVKFTLPSDQLSRALDQQLLSQLSPEVRDKLLSDAIAHLIDPAKAWDKKSQLQRAFEDALEKWIQQEAKKMVESDPTIQAAAREALQAGVAEFLMRKEPSLKRSKKKSRR